MSKNGDICFYWKIFRYRRLYGLRLFFRTTRLAYNEALAHSPLPFFVPFASLPSLSSRCMHPKKNLSESSRRVSNSGHRSIATAPYLTASVNRFGLRPANPFITHETTLTSGDGGCCISWQIYG